MKVIKSSIHFVFFMNLLILLSTAGNLFSQNEDIPAFNKLRTPVSPAFVLLGIEPVSVERPNSPSSLALSVLNSSFISLPKNFAMEFSPYWLIQHPTLTWRSDVSRNMSESITRTTTFSVATGELGSQNDSVTGLAVGLRTSLFSGKINDSNQIKLKKLEDVLGKESSIFSRFQVRITKELDSAYKKDLEKAKENPKEQERLTLLYGINQGNLNKDIHESKEYQDSLKNFQSKFSELKNLSVSREGFFLDFALGGVWGFKNAIYDSSHFERVGMWLTPSYNGNNLSTVGLARFFHYDKKSINDIFDAGGRLIWADGKYAFSGEFLGRFYLGENKPENQYRWSFIFDYEVSNGVWANVSFGKDFSSSSKGSLIAIAGLNFNFNKERYVLK